MADAELGIRDTTPFLEQVKNCWTGCVRSCKENPARWGKLISFYIGAYALMTAFMSANMGGFIESLPETKMWKNGYVWMGRPSHGNQLGMGEDGTVRNVLVMNRISYGTLGQAYPYQKDDTFSGFRNDKDLLNKDGAEAYVINSFTRSCSAAGNCDTDSGKMLIAGHLNRLWSNHELYSDFKVTCNNYYTTQPITDPKMKLKSAGNHDGTLDDGTTGAVDCTQITEARAVIFSSSPEVCAQVSDDTNSERSRAKGTATCVGTYSDTNVKEIPSVEFTWTGASPSSNGAFAPHTWEYFLEPTVATSGETVQVKTVCAAHGNECNLSPSDITAGQSCKDKDLIAYSPVFGDKKRILKFDMKSKLTNQNTDDSYGNNEGLSDPTKLVYYTTWTFTA